MDILRAKLEDVVLKHLDKKSLYGLGGNNIQGKKLRNVQEIYNLENEKVLFLYDSTLFRSAKDGIVFTENGVYWREKLGNKGRLTYREIVESTVNKDFENTDIYILNKPGLIKTKDVYYELIADLKIDLIDSLAVYETYYKNILDNFEQSLARFAQNEDFSKIIGWLNRYDGLFVSEEDKTINIRKISFQAYLNKTMFTKAKEELDVLQVKDPEFYEKAQPLLFLGVKENEFYELNVQRLRAMETKNFDLAYSLLSDQKNLDIRTNDEINKLKLETKEAQYNSLNEDRLRTIDKEEYDIAFLLLEKQKELGVKDEYKTNQIKEAMEESKDKVISKYHSDLKLLVDSKYFKEAEEVINHIYNIEPYYSLEKEEILIKIYKYDFKDAKKAIESSEDLSLKEELEEILDITTKALYKEIRTAARNKDYNYFKHLPVVWNYKDEFEMSPIDYFALEADKEGLLLAAKEMDLSLVSYNVYGHNFVDLLGFACDPNLGNKREDVLELLNAINSVNRLDEIDSRVKFLQTGNEGFLFSYYLSQETTGKIDESEIEKIKRKRLSELNKVLISDDGEQVNSQKIINLLKEKEDYPIKGEFETSDQFKDRWEEFAEASVDIDNMPDDKEVEKDILALLNLYFPVNLPTIEIGTYNSDKEVFYMIVDNKVKEMYVPILIAEKFKDHFKDLDCSVQRIVEDKEILDTCIYKFEEEKIGLIFVNRKNF